MALSAPLFSSCTSVWQRCGETSPESSPGAKRFCNNNVSRLSYLWTELFHLGGCFIYEMRERYTPWVDGSSPQSTGQFVEKREKASHHLYKEN